MWEVPGMHMMDLLYKLYLCFYIVCRNLENLTDKRERTMTNVVKLAQFLRIVLERDVLVLEE